MFEADIRLFERAPATGRKVAVVGAGPAALSCAHRLAMLGHDVVVFNRDGKPGGLNEYGIAAYKTLHDFAQREVQWILDIGGIELRNGVALGEEVSLAALLDEYDAVFLGVGLGDVNRLGIEGEDLDGVVDAVEYIAKLRQAHEQSKLPVGRRVVVIGGGMTAIDVAVQSRKLGAERVDMLYRRGPEQMGASHYEQEYAQRSGVTLYHWARPVRILGEGFVTGVEFERTELGDDGRLSATGDTFAVEADIVFKAVGQLLDERLMEAIGNPFGRQGGKLPVNGERRTSLDRVWAGGDCIADGEDLTVTAVQDGKIAAHSIDRYLRSSPPRCRRAVSERPIAANGKRTDRSHRFARRGYGSTNTMADLTSEFLGINSPNPFWLASAPPTDKAYNVNRAFEAGWGGVVWKTLGEDPPIVNVSGPRYGAIHANDRRVIGFNNIELITDRRLTTNLDEISQVKRDWPDRALVVSVMLPMQEKTWAKFVPMIEDTGADGLELNFGCPHGMSERGMGSAVGQVPEYIQMAAEWAKKVCAHAGHRETHAERHQHPATGEGRKGRRGGWGVAHQHGQFDHAGQLRHADDVSVDRRQRLARRLLRAGGETHCAAHGGGDRAACGHTGPADFGDRRRHRLARRGRFPRARRVQRPGMHGGDGVRVQDHRRPHRRAAQFPRWQGHDVGARSSSAWPCRASPTGNT